MLAASLAVAACGGGGGAAGTAPHHSLPATTAPPATAPTTTTSPPTTTSPGVPTTTTAPEPAATLSIGSSGPAVLALQERLSALHYWLGTPDGHFGDATEQAVYALQKVAGLATDGVVGPATTAALASGVVARPRSENGSGVQVDLHRGVLMIVRDGALLAALNTSTGGGYVYYDNGVAAVAVTPVGQFRVEREVDGLVVSSLGELWRPKYFYSGYAVHGESYVPPEPVSHGCVRVSVEAMDWIWERGLMPVGSSVWIY